MASEIEGLAVVAENKRSIWLPWYAFPIVATTYWFAFKYDYLGVFILVYMIAMYVFREQIAGFVLLALGMLFSYFIGVLIVDMIAVLPSWLLLAIAFLWGVVVSLGLFNIHRDSNHLHLYLLSVASKVSDFWSPIAAILKLRCCRSAMKLSRSTAAQLIDMPVSVIRAARTSLHKFFVLAREMYQTCPTDLRNGCDISVMRMFVEVDTMIASERDAASNREYLKSQQQPETGQ